MENTDQTVNDVEIREISRNNSLLQVPEGTPKSRRASLMESVQDIKANVNEVDKKRFEKLRPLAKILENIKTQILLTFLLMFSLYLADFWQIGNVHEKYDDIMNSILVIILVIFALECFLLVISTERYFLRFFFWMDVIGTLSILLDLTWITGDIIMSSYTGSTNVARAARMAKLAARAGRLVKLLRILRVLMQHNRNQERVHDQSFTKEGGNVQTLSNKIAIKLAKRVAAVVMIQILLLPFLSYNAIDHAPDVTVDSFSLLAAQGSSSCDYNCFQQMADGMVEYYDDWDDEIIEISIDGVGSFDYSDQVGYTRKNNILVIKRGESFIRISQTRRAQLTAAFSVGEITLAILLLMGFSVSFTMAMDRLIIRPIDRMMTVLRENMSTVLESMKCLEHVESNYIDSLEQNLETDMLEQILEKMIKIVRLAAPNVDEMMFEEVGLNSEDLATKDYVASQFMRNGITAMQRIKEQNHLRLSMPFRQGSIMNLVSTRAFDHGIDFEKAIGGWDFNPLDYKQTELLDFLCQIFDAVKAALTLNVDSSEFYSTCEAIANEYKDQHYHNFKHGVDVCYTTFKLLQLSRMNNFVSQIDLIAMLVAALGHDAGHPGVNNAFLINTGDDLALQHNDISPLENMHCFVLFSILKRPGTNLFRNLDQLAYKNTRKLIIQSILGTDMQHHFKQIHLLNIFYEKHVHEFNQFFTLGISPPSVNELEDQRFLLEMVLHSADISGPIKPPKISQVWADLVIKEFFDQGDKEKEQRLAVSPMMDRNATNIPNMQMGFIEFVVSPLYIAMSKLFPDLSPLMDVMLANYKHYFDLKKEEFASNLLETKNSGEEEEQLISEISKLDQKMASLIEKLQAPKDMMEKLRANAGLSSIISVNVENEV
mmetsp:Transcript_26366/g.34655  ORF Transcript_26366/g.34655 Transcript_26366/m.34655 type:complete len:883 (-) Transcript_26366:260-2908(-)